MRRDGRSCSTIRDHGGPLFQRHQRRIYISGREKAEYPNYVLIRRGSYRANSISPSASIDLQSIYMLFVMQELYACWVTLSHEIEVAKRAVVVPSRHRSRRWRGLNRLAREISHCDRHYWRWQYRCRSSGVVNAAVLAVLGRCAGPVSGVVLSRVLEVEFARSNQGLRSPAQWDAYLLPRLPRITAGRGRAGSQVCDQSRDPPALVRCRRG